MVNIIGVMFFVSYTMLLIVMSFELILHGSVIIMNRELILLNKVYETLIGWIVKLFFVVVGGFLYYQISFYS